MLDAECLSKEQTIMRLLERQRAQEEVIQVFRQKQVQHLLQIDNQQQKLVELKDKCQHQDAEYRDEIKYV